MLQAIQYICVCVCVCVYVYINLNIGYGNETIKFVITTEFLVVQIDNNLADKNVSSVCIHRCSSAYFATVAVTGLVTTDTLYWDSGAIFWAAKTSLLLQENDYSIGTFKEKSFCRELCIQFITLNFGNNYVFSL